MAHLIRSYVRSLSARSSTPITCQHSACCQHSAYVIRILGWPSCTPIELSPLLVFPPEIYSVLNWHFLLKKCAFFNKNGFNEIEFASSFQWHILIHVSSFISRNFWQSTCTLWVREKVDFAYKENYVLVSQKPISICISRQVRGSKYLYFHLLQRARIRV